MLRTDDSLPDSLSVNDIHIERIAEDNRLLVAAVPRAAVGNPRIASVGDRQTAGQLRGPRRDGDARRLPARAGRSTGTSRAGRRLGTPHVHVARMADGTTDFVLVLEDLAGLGQRRPPGRPVDGPRSDRYRRAGRAARLVARTRRIRLLWQAFPGMDTPTVRDVFFPVFGLGLADLPASTPARRCRPPVGRFAERFTEYAPQALDALTERPTLLHGDIRADNLFFSGNRAARSSTSSSPRAGRVPSTSPIWSARACPTAVRGGPRRGAGPGVPGPRLHGRGVTDYGFDAAWRDYRFAVAYLIVLPVVALMGWDVAARTVAAAVPDAHRPGGGRPSTRSTRWRCSMTSDRTAREVVELYNLVVWNERDFALADELMGGHRDSPRRRRGDTC